MLPRARRLSCRARSQDRVLELFGHGVTHVRGAGVSGLGLWAQGTVVRGCQHGAVDHSRMRHQGSQELGVLGHAFVS